MQRLPAELRRFLQESPYEELSERWTFLLSSVPPEQYTSMRRAICADDRFYLLTQVLHRGDADHPWVYTRCREVENEPDGMLDLWAREHYKSTIITFAGTIQEIIRDSDITVGIFSHTRPDATKFLVQIKSELEMNRELKGLFPDVFYADPENESPLWTKETGIVVKRTTNAREATVEAHGVVDSQPVGSHFRLMIFDDLVTMLSVSTPEQVEKTTQRHALADSLGARGTNGLKRKWHIGTRYSFADTYQYLIDNQVLKLRKYPATHDGTMMGRPVFLSEEAWRLEKTKPTNIVAAQMLQNPAAGTEAMFQESWLDGKFLHIRPATLTIGIMVDPASSKKKRSDSTVMHVWGMDSARNRFLLDGFHHKMSLSERWIHLRDLHKRWTNEPGVQFVKVGYERYGSTSDLEYFQERMEIETYYFDITELAWPRESEEKSKFDRIQRLEPDHRLGKLYFARKMPDGVRETPDQAAARAAGQSFRIWTPTRRRDHLGVAYGINKKYFDEYLLYPFSPHDDALDCASRWMDMDMRPPVVIADDRILEPEIFEDGA